MRHFSRNSILICVVLGLSLSLALAQADSSDQSYQAERQKAIDLFNHDKYLEALPLFEDLIKKNPKDDVAYLALGSCLLSHSATLEDDDAATKERLRAREMLLKAKELGNTSALLQNLLQLVPADGRIPYSKTPEDQAMQKGEAAFARNDYAEAIKNYSRALELNPANYSAALFVGDSYFAAKDWAKAGEWYGKAIAINPNAETAYRYYSDMLTKNGETEKARKLAIQAVVAEPYNPISWRGLEQWARSNRLTLNQVQINAPQNSVSQTDDKHINVTVNPTQSTDATAIWLAYSLSRAKWRTDFKKHFPEEKEYRHSLAEETEALTLAASVCQELAESNAKKEQKSSLPKDPDLQLLLKVNQAKMIEPYILLNAADDGIAHDYEAYREKNRSALETYLSDFVVPPAPGH